MNKGKMERIAKLNNMIESAEESLNDLKCRLANETDSNKADRIQDYIEEVEEYINHYTGILSCL